MRNVVIKLLEPGSLRWHAPIGGAARPIWSGNRSSVYVDLSVLSRYAPECLRAPYHAHGERVTIGEYRLRLVARDWALRAYLAVPDDWRAPFLIAAYKLNESLIEAWFALLRIGAIWGLVEVREFQEPSWRDVKPLDRLARWLGK